MGHSLYGGWNLHRQVSTADSGVFESVRVCTGVDSNGDPHLGDDLLCIIVVVFIVLVRRIEKKGKNNAYG